jgi:hypothetical protein
MWTRRRTERAVLVCVTLLGSGCDGTDHVPSQPSLGPVFAGTYKLTIRRPDHCNGRPGVVDTLQYDARLEPTPFAYTAIQVQGEGYTKPTGLGEIWHAAGTRNLSLSWNIYDPSGCSSDRQYEDLGNGTSRAICGTGPGRLNGNIIAADVDGELVIHRVTGLSTVCVGRFAFTFEPVP